MNSEWKSIHIYIDVNQNTYLSYRIFPMIQDLVRFKFIEKFFFIRYSDPLPHIRFRFRVGSRQYIKVYRVLIKTFGKINLKSKEYVPELSRYGGLVHIKIAENQFYFSSLICMKLMQTNAKKWNYETALGKAIELHLGLLFAFGFKPSDVQVLFKQSMFGWLHYASDENLGIKEAILNDFNTLLQRENNLSARIQEIWFIIANHEALTQDWLKEWLQNMHTIYQEHTNAIALAPFMISNEYLLEGSKHFDVEKLKLFCLCESFIHMTNNRLGIHNQDEAYLAFIITKSFETIA